MADNITGSSPPSNLNNSTYNPGPSYTHPTSPSYVRSNFGYESRSPDRGALPSLIGPGLAPSMTPDYPHQQPAAVGAYSSSTLVRPSSMSRVNDLPPQAWTYTAQPPLSSSAAYNPYPGPSPTGQRRVLSGPGVPAPLPPLATAELAHRAGGLDMLAQVVSAATEERARARDARRANGDGRNHAPSPNPALAPSNSLAYPGEDKSRYKKAPQDRHMTMMDRILGDPNDSYNWLANQTTDASTPATSSYLPPDPTPPPAVSSARSRPAAKSSKSKKKKPKESVPEERPLPATPAMDVDAEVDAELLSMIEDAPAPADGTSMKDTATDEWDALLMRPSPVPSNQGSMAPPPDPTEGGKKKVCWLFLLLYLKC
jgi:hypothetical protein